MEATWFFEMFRICHPTEHPRSETLGKLLWESGIVQSGFIDWEG